MVVPLVYAAGYAAVQYGIPMIATGYAAYQAGQVLADPETQRAIGAAAKSLTNALTRDDEQAGVNATSGTNEEAQKCDGPHNGRLQVQGYAKNVDPPGGIELSKPWNRQCNAPLKAEGLVWVSTLQAETTVISFKSAGYRGPAFSKMSKYIKKSPPSGLTPFHSTGWGINPTTGKAVKNYKAGRNGARVDLEIKKGRAFGSR